MSRPNRPDRGTVGHDSHVSAQTHRRIREALAEIDAGLSGSGRVELWMVRRVHEAIGEFLALYDSHEAAS